MSSHKSKNQNKKAKGLAKAKDKNRIQNNSVPSVSNDKENSNLLNKSQLPMDPTNDNAADKVDPDRENSLIMSFNWSVEGDVFSEKQRESVMISECYLSNHNDLDVVLCLFGSGCQSEPQNTTHDHRLCVLLCQGTSSKENQPVGSFDWQVVMKVTRGQGPGMTETISKRVQFKHSESDLIFPIFNMSSDNYFHFKNISFDPSNLDDKPTILIQCHVYENQYNCQCNQ